MRIHKEGLVTIIITAVLLAILNYFFFRLIPIIIIAYLLLLLSTGFFFVILYFFRKPNRNIAIFGNKIIAPADGKLVAIEEIEEKEYFKDKRIQVSIFMSPLNVHVNWAPISGKVNFYKYHPGKHLVAWHPKSSLDNERTTTVITHNSNQEIMVRQIAGAVARRIVCYAKNDKEFMQGEEIGFIKFGSRVDIILPLNAKIKVEIGQKIIGLQTIIAELI